MKRWTLLIAILLVWLPAAVHAHSSLEDATPKEGETVTESVKNIQLTFDTRVESGSSFTVKGKDGQVIEPQNLQVTGDTISGHLPGKLETGRYQVEWKVIGADGHPVSGSYTFEVKTSDSTSTGTEEEKADEPPQTSDEESGDTGTDQPSTLLIGLIAALGVAAVAILILLLRKKR